MDATRSVHVSDFEKRLLVWYKRFPNMESVPQTVR